MDLSRYCRICLESKDGDGIFSIYLHIQQKYLPSIIENISGVVISPHDDPGALVCNECSNSILRAKEIITKCQESNERLQVQRNFFSNMQKLSQNQYSLGHESTLKEKEDTWPSIHSPPRFKEEHDGYFQDQSDNPCIYQENDVKPEMIVESILEDSNDKSNKTIIRRSRKRKENVNDIGHTPSQNSPASLYHSHFKTSKPKKPFIRSREQYLKRKIRNFPVKEPLTLIGGAGVIRKRKPKSYHRAIPNFYFRCELCHEFESNVASYAVTHLTTVHGIERPAIFRCSQCDAKPFIKNQSLQEHIATIHEQQPKRRDFACSECGKTFIKNCHLQKHLLSVHKIGEMPYRCNVKECGKGYVDSYALRMHLKQTHSQINLELLDI
ncbi:uncharacterized protein LOC142236577 [Haematobia irritans]|uniref:uncharacterized protein LOC142236577 n=1 Tax=Haematobia irritans TaxID=7368 RepID=UPI003F502780